MCNDRVIITLDRGGNECIVEQGTGCRERATGKTILGLKIFFISFQGRGCRNHQVGDKIPGATKL